MSGRFEGKALVVTGAAQGIGRRVAERAAAEGARVALVDRSPLGAEVAASIGAPACFVEADLETADGAARAIAAAGDALGRIDVLVNNVGGAIWMKPFEHFTADEIAREINRSLFPTLWCCHAVLPGMLAQGAGVIVNVSSIATRGINRVPYSAAKGGVNAITASLAWEVAERGVRVVGAAPGGTDAPPRAIPRNAARPTRRDKAWVKQVVDQTIQSSLMKRYGTLDEQASVILFLASDEASYLTGVTVPVGGGDLG